MAQRTRLQRGVGVALWRQIADAIRHGIATGLADENRRLPPEAKLAERFGVNRHTVRAAIAALAHEGVLQSQQGRGTMSVARIVSFIRSANARALPRDWATKHARRAQS